MVKEDNNLVHTDAPDSSSSRQQCNGHQGFRGASNATGKLHHHLRNDPEATEQRYHSRVMHASLKQAPITG